jgi:hypothetical protein
MVVEEIQRQQEQPIALQNRKLTADDVLTIRTRYAKDRSLTYRQLATEYHKSPLTIGQIIRGETWTQVKGIVGVNTRRKWQYQGKRKRNLAKLSPAKVRQMLSDYNQNTTLTYADLAAGYKLPRSVVEEAFRSLEHWLTVEEITEIGWPKKAVRGARRGERHPSANLSDKQIKALREKRASNPAYWTLGRLATEYGVCESMVSRVVRGKSRLDAGGPLVADVPVESNREQWSHE